MNPRALIALPILMAVALAGSAIADTSRPSATNGVALTLRYGKETPAEAIQPLYAKAVELLESSNFNSRDPKPRWGWNMPEILEGYRQTVSGKYFLVTFKEPRKFKTVGGEISVREIVVGLNRQDYASSLFTVDDEGRIVGHAKYSGQICVEFLKLVKEISSGS